MVVKTVSGSVASWPATGNVTTRPLPVLDNIQTLIDEDTKEGMSSSVEILILKL